MSKWVKFGEWMSSGSGQAVLMVGIVVLLVIYVCVIWFEDKWG